MLKKTNQLKEINKMDKIRSYKTLIEYINNIHDIKLTKKDLYRKKGFLFVNIKKYNTVEIFDYPVNNLIEVGNHITNWNNKNIKDLVNNDIKFESDNGEPLEYPSLKKEPYIIKYISTNNA